jgi:chromosome segregation ATPase
MKKSYVEQELMKAEVEVLEESEKTYKGL